MTVKWFVDKAQLDVEADVFAEVADGVVGFGAKDGADFEDAFEDADHDLLIELGALRQVGRAAEVVDGKDVGAAFGGGGDELGGLDLGKALAGEIAAEGAHDAGGEAVDGAAGGVAVDGDGVVELGDEGGLDLALGEEDGRPFGDGLEDRDGGMVDFDAAGGLGGGGGDARNGDDGFEFGELDGRVDDDLGGAPAVAKDSEGEGAEAADGVEPALEEDGFAGVRGLRHGEQFSGAGARAWVRDGSHVCVSFDRLWFAPGGEWDECAVPQASDLRSDVTVRTRVGRCPRWDCRRRRSSRHPFG